MKPLACLIFLLSFIATGCLSYEERAAERTAHLRTMYPPGTSKNEVQASWGKNRPDFSASRPVNGWSAFPIDGIAKKLLDIEARTGKRIESVDRFWGPDEWMSLCYCWYYYDAEGKIIDVEWQYKSD